MKTFPMSVLWLFIAIPFSVSYVEDPEQKRRRVSPSPAPFEFDGWNTDFTENERMRISGIELEVPSEADAIQKKKNAYTGNRNHTWVGKWHLSDEVLT